MFENLNFVRILAIFGVVAGAFLLAVLFALVSGIFKYYWDEEDD